LPLPYQSGDYPESEKKRLAKIGLKAFLKMVFLDNFVHGDLHPGNIFVTENPTNKCVSLRDSESESRDVYVG
jgi:predicted unusual protein kinase regulating ubiquinone biosynthesis (AarF/ABC1/UbiB family)